ncbi:MAG: FKBP-type peptidyl-prolyl cis-trans isomerase [Phycisphaerales bacterium]
MSLASRQHRRVRRSPLVTTAAAITGLGLLAAAGSHVSGYQAAPAAEAPPTYLGGPGFDYSTVPPPHEQTVNNLNVRGVGLAEAIGLAIAAVQGDGETAVASDARFIRRTDPLDAIMVLVYHGDSATRVILDADTGAVISQLDTPRLPGRPVQGEPTVLAGGTQYWELVAGEGDPAPNEQSNVRMQYTGYLLDGSIWESTDDFGRPLTHPLGSLLPGWKAGMADMKPGAIRKLVIPPEQALGSFGSPPSIPPNAALVVDVELLRIVDYRTVPEQLPGIAVEGEPQGEAGELQWWVLAASDDRKPESLDVIVDVHVTTYLTDGTEVTNTRGPNTSGKPLRVSLRRWLNGPSEGVMGMSIGESRKLIVPSKLAYGTKARGGVPAGATLIMDIELVDILDR